MFADPGRRRYPLDTRQEVHAAIAHFCANFRAYPPARRAEIRRRIRAQAAHYGISLHAPCLR